MGAIHAGKHVVTANKALIAAYLPEIQAALAANPTVRLGCVFVLVFLHMIPHLRLALGTSSSIIH